MVKNLFASQIYQAKIMKSKTDLLELSREIYKIRDIDLVGQKWSKKNYVIGYTSYGSMDQLQQFSSSFSDLNQMLKPHLKTFLKSLGFKISVNQLQLNSMWTNIMSQGSHHSFHIHPLSVISGTFYVQVTKGSAAIQFEDPRHGLMMASPPRDGVFHSLVPTAGDVVLFESWMRHQVPAQTVKQDRISVSFNYDWR